MKENQARDIAATIVRHLERHEIALADSADLISRNSAIDIITAALVYAPRCMAVPSEKGGWSIRHIGTNRIQEAVRQGPSEGFMWFWKDSSDVALLARMREARMDFGRTQFGARDLRYAYGYLQDFVECRAELRNRRLGRMLAGQKSRLPA